MRRRTTLLALAALALGAVAAAPTDPGGALCTAVPDPPRWEDPATPDVGADPAIIAVHRGAANLAPENTLDADRYAIAYGVEMIEVDVQETLDGRFVAFHDLEVDAKTDGTGQIFLLTYDEVRALNAADNGKWRGSAYDPAQIPSLEEVLALARDTGTGVMFDVKESVRNLAGLANLAAAYGVLERSVFIPYVPPRGEVILAAQPTARLNFSNQFGELPDGAPAGVLYALTREYWSFGSSLPAFDAGDIAEIHDGCGLVIPNVYQGHVTGSEAGDLAYARSIGADGAQVNNPDVAVAVLGRPVATRLDVRPGGAAEVCLVDATHGFGLPGKLLDLGDGATFVAGRGGCAPLPVGTHVGRIRFPGDASALPSTAIDRARGR
jgi:hypothetical protein